MMHSLRHRAFCLFRYLVVAAALGAAGGCGQTGPLFLPPAGQSGGDNGGSAQER